MTQRCICIVDDEPGMRSALMRLFKGEGLPAQAFESATQFLEACASVDCGCLLLDVNMPVMTGLELQQELRERQVRIPIVFLTGSGDVSMAVAGMKAGAVDFLEKPFDSAALIARVREALQLDDETRADRALYEETRAHLETLTAREREVLDLIVAGRSNKMTAYLLGSSPRAVEVHRSRIMEKMRADSVAELVRLVLIVRA